MVLEEDELVIEINLKDMEKLKEAIKRFGKCDELMHFKLNDVVKFEARTIRIKLEVECPACGEMVPVLIFNLHLLCDDRIHVYLDKIKEFIEKI